MDQQVMPPPAVAPAGIVMPILCSPAINQIAAALAKAQGQFDAPSKNKEVTVRSDKGAYKFRYATLDAIIAAVQGPLSENGLSFVQVMARDAANAPVVRTLLMHASGQWMAGDMPLFTDGGSNKMQAMGSALTYAKRYSLCGLLGIAADEDDDGNASDGNHIERAEERPPQRRTASTAAPAATKGPIYAPGSMSIQADSQAEWLQRMTKAVERAETASAVNAIERDNKAGLDQLKRDNPAAQAQLMSVLAARRDDLAQGATVLQAG